MMVKIDYETYLNNDVAVSVTGRELLNIREQYAGEGKDLSTILVVTNMGMEALDYLTSENISAPLTSSDLPYMDSLDNDIPYVASLLTVRVGLNFAKTNFNTFIIGAGCDPHSIRDCMVFVKNQSQKFYNQKVPAKFKIVMPKKYHTKQLVQELKRMDS